MLPEPNCYKRRCRHFIGVEQPDGTEPSEYLVCAAFPAGIPAEIAYGNNLHLQPYPGDNGTQFEVPRPGEEIDYRCQGTKV